MNHIEENLIVITGLCRKYRVKSLSLFGSMATGHFRPDSDVDLVVEFEDMPVELYADNYFDLKFAIEDLLGRKVDLLEHRALRNPFLIERINSEKRLLYAA